MQLQDILISPMTNMEITVVLKTKPLSTAVSRMDISAILNEPGEPDGQARSMDIDSPPSAHYTPSSSPENSPSMGAIEPQVTRVYPHRSPSMIDRSDPSVTTPPRFENCLPSLSSLFPPGITSGNHARAHYCDPMETVMIEHRDSRTRPLRRQYHRPAPRPLSPKMDHHRVFRRRSHPQPSWNVPVYRTPGDHLWYQQPAILIDDHDTHYDSSSSPVGKSKKPKGSHNNKAYAQEMVHWMRYFAVDRDMKYNDLVPLFWEQFPERWDPVTAAFATGQMISSRLYRDNFRPWLDANENWSLDAKGRLRIVPIGVREQATAEGKDVNFPNTLVDKWPAKLLQYKWKMPILEEHKEMARRILKGDDPSDPQGKKATWRRILNECEEHIYKPEN